MLKKRKTILHILSVGFIIPSLFFGQSVFAEEITNDTSEITKTFNTEKEALEWIDSFDKSVYEVKSNIKTSTVSGVTADIDPSKDPDKNGYEIVYDSETGTTVIRITGGLENISVELPYADAEYEPGDQEKFNFEIINESGDQYDNNGVQYIDSGLGFKEGASMESTIAHLSPFASKTYNFIRAKYGLDQYDKFNQSNQYNYYRQQITMDLIPEGTTVIDVTSAPKFNEETYNAGPYYHDTTKDEYYLIEREENPKWRGHINADNVLEYYNSRLGTAYTDLMTAWNEFFYTYCFKVSYSTPLESINLPKNASVPFTVIQSLDGPETDNMYEETVWNRTDVIKFNCPNKMQYIATVSLNKIPDKIPDKNEKTANTSTQTNVGLLFSIAGLSLSIVILLVFKEHRA